VARLRERMSQGDRDEARRLAHVLKGSSGNLGVAGVQRLAAELESAITDGGGAPDIERPADAVETELRRVTAAIRAALAQTEEPPVAGVADRPAARRVLAELEPLLAASSIQANRLVEENAALLKATLGPVGGELERQVEHFLYPEALETLKRWREDERGRQ
jgi:two-component system sensor histidine kinase/response regulator